MSMRRLGVSLASALSCVLLVAACGDDGPDRATDPAASSSAPSKPSASSSPPAASNGPVDFTVVKMLSAARGGGRVSTTAVPVPDVAAAREFAVQFGDSDLAAQVVGAVGTAQVPPGMSLYAAVVGLGCSAPKQLQVTRVGSGFAIAPAQVGLPVQCFAPVTHVALVAIGD